MRKMLVLWGICGLIATAVAGPYKLVWANYDYINPGSDVTRGLAYNRTTDHLLIATRKDKPRVVILDPEDGNYLGVLDTAVAFSGGTYPLNLVTTNEVGVVYVCNLCAPQATPGVTLKIYRYANEASPLELVFDNALDGGRYGDAFAAYTTGSLTFLYISGMGNNKIAVLRDDGGSALTLEGYINLPQPGNARHGISPVAENGGLWINGADTGLPPARWIALDGTVLATVPDTLLSPGGSATVTHWSVRDINLVTTTNVFTSNSIRTVRYFEDELGTVSFGYFGGNSDTLLLGYNGTTHNNNINGSSILQYDDTRHRMYVLSGVNSIAAVDLDGLLKVRTPRDSGLLKVQLDGKDKEYCEYDFVGVSNWRYLNLTWDQNLACFGLRGSALLDNTGTNELYLAFDLDPDGTNGTGTPPTVAGGIRSLPFLADVVVQFDSYDQNDWTTGKVFKWNGTSWASTAIDGFDIGYGAMAVIGEGADSLITEIGVARNSAGLGENFTKLGMLVYVAQKTADGAVLCAFPDDNPIGKGVAFNRFYQVDSLGSGMFAANGKYVRVMSGYVGIAAELETQPLTFHLAQNFPNPFNPVTQIQYILPRRVRVRLEILNLLGQVVAQPENTWREAGHYAVNFDGHFLNTGIYLCRLVVDGKTVATRKMVLLK